MTTERTLEEAMQDLENVNHFIEKDKAASMINRFTTHRNRLFKPSRNFTTLPFDAPALPHCITFNKTAVASLIERQDSVAIRIYPAINQEQKLTFVLVSANAAGENIYLNNEDAGPGDFMIGLGNTGLLDEGQASPPYPAPMLNI